jgi:hypothetical protein
MTSATLMLAVEVWSAMATWVAPGSAKDAERYMEIAEDIATVAQESPVFAGDDGRQTAIMMASIASLESFYRADVDEFAVRGDNGRSWGLMQVQPRRGEACDDRIACLRLGRDRIKESMGSCRRTADPLALYISGPRCLSTWGSRERWRRAASWLGTQPRPDEWRGL